MKLIALKSFRNVQALGIKLEDANNNNHIDKGELLEIGDGKDFKGCNAAHKAIIGQLVYAGCVGDATDRKIVEAVKAEIEIDKAREAAAARLASASDASSLVATLTALLAKGAEASTAKPGKSGPPAT